MSKGVNHIDPTFQTQDQDSGKDTIVMLFTPIQIAKNTRQNIYKKQQLYITDYLIVETATDRQKQITHNKAFVVPI